MPAGNVRAYHTFSLTSAVDANSISFESPPSLPKPQASKCETAGSYMCRTPQVTSACDEVQQVALLLQHSNETNDCRSFS
jgi:hypothetical protein